MPSELSSPARIDEVIDRHRHNPSRLVQILREAQELDGYLPPPTITHIANALRLPRARVEGTADFYSFLHLAPVGRYRVLFSNNITDRMQGSVPLMQYMCRRFAVTPGKVSDDGLVSIDTTSCTGMCDQGPGVLVNGWAIPAMTRERVDRIIDLMRSQVPVSSWPRDLFAVVDNIRRKDILFNYTPTAGEVLQAALARGARTEMEFASNERSWREMMPTAARGPVETLEEIKRSRLRGRGGAGFTTGLKWEACRAALGQRRFVVCNADEGEPGTFKDRVLLTRHADLMFDGMTVCAYIVGANKGFLYLRGEYRYLLESLQAVIERRRAANLLGDSILGQPGLDFDIEIHVGAGAYICGEESALLESLEGERGVPRNRRPYPVTNGYFNQPTVVNNVETFCNAALIATHGADWYRDVGTSKSAGTKVLSVSGDCARPGIYEYPFGVSIAEILADAGATKTQAVQVGGPSGILLDETEFGRRIAFEDIPTGGSLMIFGHQRDMFDVARNFSHFFAHESCGFCTPCRVGTTVLKNCLDKIEEGHGSQHDINEILEIAGVLQAASHCGLGHTACNPVFDSLKKFRPAFEQRLASLEFRPAFDLDGALAAARQMTGRDDAGAHLHT